MNVNVEEIKSNCLKVESCLYRSSSNTVYKIFCDSNKQDDLQKEKLEYLLTLPHMDSFNSPVDILFEQGKVCGYEENYFENAYPLSKFNMPLNIKQKKLLFKQAFNALKTIHNYYVIGDIHNDNIITDGKDIYFIDLESGSPTMCNYPVVVKYVINNLNTLQQEDSLKLFISYLSFIYNYNFESLFQNKSCYDIFEFILNHKFSSDEKDFISNFYYEMLLQGDKTIYFDDYINTSGKIRKRFVKSLYK